MKKALIGMVSAVICFALCAVVLAESKYNVGLTAAGVRVNFGAKDYPRVVTAVSVETGTTGKKVLFYGRTGSPVYPSAFTTTNITAQQSGVAITNSDVLIYQHANGTLDYLTVASATTNNIYVTSAPSPAYAAGDTIYEMTQIGMMSIGVTNGDGLAILNAFGTSLLKTPNDSPLSVFVDSSTNNYVTVTAE